MRLLILTTQTPHHARFLHVIVDRFPVMRVLEETSAIAAPFKVAHPFETERDAFEQDTWFEGREVRLEEFAPASRHQSLNDDATVSEIAALKADATIVFGTRCLKPAVIAAAGPNLINLHGGDPESYRGLDTHLWAIYHGEFADLVSTLHTVNEELDDGRIVETLPVPLSRGMTLHKLRAANTGVCIRLTLSALEELNDRGSLTSRPQRSCGRYYSFMPTILKDVCLHKFQHYTQQLP